MSCLISTASFLHSYIHSFSSSVFSLALGVLHAQVEARTDLATAVLFFFNKNH